ncbi:hypothetical protein POG22_09105 [Geitlerinema sp. CS-897]|nr:hypothetical protein [Geitlerinema sp. CS-897]
MDGREIPFELKSTTKFSVTTVRDFNFDHVRKWQGKHWLFGFYDKGGRSLRYCLYASPQMMEPWIQEKARYIAPDIQLSRITPERLQLSDLYRILGEKSSYTLDDAKALHKRQYTFSEYRAKMDLENGYSTSRMLEILRDRCQYLIERGSTLNNPHIPGSYFQNWEQITECHAERLRELVRDAL